ncbi:MAG: cytidylate kinase-like family protein [Dehalococcoidales bacterium]|nr:cytidylate kinase-like family protein [Dehalococcoidales bacterium]
MPLVTIRGQMGSGAPEIGKLAAALLKVDYVDREIIAEVAAAINRSDIEIMAKERPSTNLLERIGEALAQSAIRRGVASAYLSTSAMPLDDKRYLKGLTSVIRELAKTQRIVIRGRGSQFILKDYPRALHVFVIAPLKMRVTRVMTDLKLDEKEAKKEIVNSDSSRREFTRSYFHAELEDPALYDLVINTKNLNFKAAASIIANALRNKEGRKNPARR